MRLSFRRTGLTLATKYAFGHSLFVDEFPDDPSDPQPTVFLRSMEMTVSGAEVQFLRLSCEEFITSLEQFQWLSLSRKAYLPNVELSAFSTSNAGAASRAFRPGAVLYRLLSDRLEDRRGSGIKQSQRIQSLCRLASLIYIHAVLWDYRQSLVSTDQYMGWIQSHIEETSAWSCSIEALLWILLSLGDNGRSQNSKRMRFVLRMMMIARLLSFESWNKVNDILFDCLVVEDSSVAKGLDLRWNAEQIRAEVTSDWAPGE